MFYNDTNDKALRFGDVLRGYVLAASNIEQPILDANYKINVDLPIFCVVLTPCCSIGDNIISLSPLIQIYSSFFRNPYFIEDFTRINRKMEPQQSVSADIWAKFPPEEQQKRLEKGISYALLELFIYEKNNLFPEYEISLKRDHTTEKHKTNYYMIDFRNIYKINCSKIVNSKDAPFESKCLQLSVETRSELRDKIAYYYGRPPDEDIILAT